MDERKIEIIIYATDENFLARLIQSLEAAVVPENFSAEIQPVTGEEKYFAYDEAMRASDAKYKIYLDERAVVTDENFLIELLEIFQDKKIGAVGTSGTIELSTHGVSLTSDKRAPKNFCGRAEIVDGFFFATQYDLPWRYDLFKDNFFGGQAQCVEFKRAGYKIFIGGDWISYSGENFKINEAARNIFLDEYSKDLFPLVSVLIPTFNRPKYFKQALDSVLNQTYRNFEIVISDDSTNDETEAVIQKYLDDPRIKYFRHKGFTAHDNWNFLRAYNNPAAEYVNWLMDDDFFHPTKLEKMIEVYRTNPDVSLVTSAKNFIDADGKIIGDTKNLFGCDVKIPGDEAARLLFLWDNYIGEPTTVLIRKKFLRDGDLCLNADETGAFSLVDVSTWLQLLSKGNMFRFSECLSSFRLHAGHAGGSTNVKVLLAVSYTKLLKDSMDKKIFKNENELHAAMFFILNYQLQKLKEAFAKNYRGKSVETLEKYFAATAQALSNGYKLELPPRGYSEEELEREQLKEGD